MNDADHIRRYISESKMNQKKALRKVQTSIEQEICKNYNDPFLRFLKDKLNEDLENKLTFSKPPLLTSRSDSNLNTRNNTLSTNFNSNMDTNNDNKTQRNVSNSALNNKQLFGVSKDKLKFKMRLSKATVYDNQMRHEADAKKLNEDEMKKLTNSASHVLTKISHASNHQSMN